MAGKYVWTYWQKNEGIQTETVFRVGTLIFFQG